MRRTPTWLNNYERPMPAVVFGAPISTSGRKPSRYTGAGDDGKVQTSKPVETELFQDHEGEYVVSANDVDKNGGPIGIEKKLNISNKPIPAPMPIQGFCRGGLVKKYQTGGLVTDELKNPANEYTYKQDESGAWKKYNVQGQEINAQGSSAAAGGTINPISGTTYKTEGGTTKAYDQSGNLINTQGSSPAAGGIVNPISGQTYKQDASGAYKAYDTQGREINVQGSSPAAGGTVDPISSRTYKQDESGVYRAYDAQGNEINVQGSSPAAGGVVDQQTGITTKTDPDGTIHKYDSAGNEFQTIRPQTPATSTEVSAGTQEAADRDYYSSKAGDYEQMMNDIATGESPIFKKLSDIAFNNLNPQLQVGLSLTAMQIAQNPSLTEGAKQTMMAQAIRNVGIQQSGVASELAQKSMEMAQQAISQGFTMSANQQAFYETARANAKNESWQDFEYTAQYGSDQDVIDAYKRATGNDLNPSAVSEIRGYARQKRSNDLVSEQLTIQGLRSELGDQDYNSAVSMINSGATYEQVADRFPSITQDMYDSIYDAGTLGNRDYDRQMGMLNTLITTGGEENLTQAAGLLNEMFPGTNIDFSNIIQSDKVSEFNNGMEQLNMLIAGDADWDTVKRTMDELGFTEMLGGERQLESLWNSAKTAASPIYQLLGTYSDILKDQFPAPEGTNEDEWLSTVKSIITNNVSYNSEAGTWVPDYDGMVAQLTAKSAGPVMPQASGGSLIPEASYSSEDLDTYAGDDAPKAGDDEWTDSTTGTTWYEQDNGSWTTENPIADKEIDISANDIVVNQNNVGFGFDKDKPSYWNGGGWTPIDEGQTFELSSQTKIDGINTALPKGKYELKKVTANLNDIYGRTGLSDRSYYVYENLETGQQYLAYTGQGENATILNALNVKQ